MNTWSSRMMLIPALLAPGCAASGASHSSSLPSQNLTSIALAGAPLSVASYANARRASGSGSYQANQSLVFVGNFPDNEVYVYRTADLSSNPSPIATIATQENCPYGLAADKEGTIYVAAGCYITGGDVEEYPKGSTTLQKTITDGISHPSGLAIDEKQTLYVADSSPAAIQEYAPGATSPKKTISGSPLGEPFGLALDKSGNLYIADFVAGAVFELPARGSSVTNLNLQNLEEPLGVAVDQKHGLLWVTDGEGQKINVYKLGSTTPMESISGFNFPYAISLENKGSPRDAVVISDQEDRSSGQSGSVFAYKPHQYTPYATLTTDLDEPSSLLITKP